MATFFRPLLFPQARILRSRGHLPLPSSLILGLHWCAEVAVASVCVPSLVLSKTAPWRRRERKKGNAKKVKKTTTAHEQSPQKATATRLCNLLSCPLHRVLPPLPSAHFSAALPAGSAAEGFNFRTGEKSNYPRILGFHPRPFHPLPSPLFPSPSFLSPSLSHTLFFLIFFRFPLENFGFTSSNFYFSSQVCSPLFVSIGVSQDESRDEFQEEREHQWARFFFFLGSVWLYTGDCPS